MNPPLSLGARIVDLRHRIGFSRAELGRVFGVSWRSVARWESGWGNSTWTYEIERHIIELLDALDAGSLPRWRSPQSPPPVPLQAAAAPLRGTDATSPEPGQQDP
jgi:DNA-binding XRE family transcriptional regulator